MKRRMDATLGCGRFLTIILAAFVATACGSGEMDNGEQDSKRSSGDGRKATEGSGDDDDAGDDGIDGGGDDTDGEGTGGDEAGGDVAGGDESADDGEAGSDAGRQFFDDAIVPMFEAQCVSCHADPRIPVDVRAPVSIYSYDLMMDFLGQGAGPRSNGLYNKVRSITAHTGGDRCSRDPGATPCKEIVMWWDLEFGEGGDGSNSDVPVGRISDVSSLGSVIGYAYDPNDTNATVTVHLYGDGPKGTGTLIASVVANQIGSDGNTPGDHAFTFQLPEAWRDGNEHTLHAYIDDSDTPMLTAPRAYTAYAFSQAGRDYYNANVRGALNGCAGCHTISYEQQFYSLIAPSPAEGGSATDNQLLNKPAQTNNTSHGGGLRCNGINASPCNVIRQWWTIEFGG